MCVCVCVCVCFPPHAVKVKTTSPGVLYFSPWPHGDNQPVKTCFSFCMCDQDNWTSSYFLTALSCLRLYQPSARSSCDRTPAPGSGRACEYDMQRNKYRGRVGKLDVGYLWLPLLCPHTGSKAASHWAWNTNTAGSPRVERFKKKMFLFSECKYIFCFDWLH